MNDLFAGYNPVYNEQTDSLIFAAGPEPAYRKKLNEAISVYLSEKSGDVVGIEIHGFRKMQLECSLLKVDHKRRSSKI